MKFLYLLYDTIRVVRVTLKGYTTKTNHSNANLVVIVRDENIICRDTAKTNHSNAILVAFVQHQH